MNFIFNAIRNLRPLSSFGVEDSYESIIWNDENTQPPTKNEVEEEVKRLEKEYFNLEYSRKRKEEYPSIEQQLDDLYHLGYDGWKSKIFEIKSKYPKV